jgi:hypothetical protein
LRARLKEAAEEARKAEDERHGHKNREGGKTLLTKIRDMAGALVAGVHFMCALACGLRASVRQRGTGSIAFFPRG